MKHVTRNIWVIAVVAGVCGCCSHGGISETAPIVPYEIVPLCPGHRSRVKDMALGIFVVPTWVEEVAEEKTSTDPAELEARGVEGNRPSSLEELVAAFFGFSTSDPRESWHGLTYDRRLHVLYVVAESNAIDRAFAFNAKMMNLATNQPLGSKNGVRVHK